MPMAPYRRSPPVRVKRQPAPKHVGTRDITAAWRYLAVIAVIRLVLAFLHGERPFHELSVTEPGFAFFLLLVAAPRALRGLRMSSAEREASRDTL